MNEWTQWPSWRRLAAIARAPVGRSAAATGALAAGSLAELIETLERYAPEGYPAAIEAITGQLLQHSAAIAPLVVLVNTVHLTLPSGPEALVSELRETERRMAGATGQLASVAANLIEEGSIVLTHGGSGMVQAMLIRAAEERHFFVSCAATLPMGEGVELAADLAAAGLSVEVASDDDALESLADVDLVLVGADALGPEQVMSTLGTAGLAKDAWDLGVPFYVLASVDKALPSPLFERAAAAGLAEGRYEAFPLAQVTAVACEMGWLDPEAAGKLASGRQVSAALLEQPDIGRKALRQRLRQVPAGRLRADPGSASFSGSAGGRRGGDPRRNPASG